LEAHPVEGDDAAETLREVLDLEHCGHLMIHTLVRRRHPVTTTAAMITRPCTATWAYGLTPIRMRPLARTTMMSTPTKLRSTPPRPPVSRVPPSTTAVMAVNMVPAPIVGISTPSC